MDQAHMKAAAVGGSLGTAAMVGALLTGRSWKFAIGVLLAPPLLAVAGSRIYQALRPAE